MLSLWFCWGYWSEKNPNIREAFIILSLILQRSCHDLSIFPKDWDCLPNEWCSKQCKKMVETGKGAGAFQRADLEKLRGRQIPAKRWSRPRPTGPANLAVDGLF